jgi:3-isopropylmalate dehydrogenase
MGRRTYQIAVLKGDGIGIEVIDEALKVLGALEKKGGPACCFTEYPAGAGCYLEQGTPLPASTVEGCRRGDAVLLGAMGLPQVRWPDGTEMRPQVDLRIQLDLYAGVRPAYLYAAHHSPLKGRKAGDIDLVVLRENVEGLFASLNGGIELRGEVAVDSMVITRSGTQRLMRYAFELARQRGKAKPKVTCVDKANIFRSMAFFRRLYDEAAACYPEVAREYAYVDAMSLYLVRQPEAYDVLVMENMFGDILSDLAAGLVGGLGLAPSADIGDQAAVFQPVHGTAPDIAGQGIANPAGAILSAGMMMRWLGLRHQDPEAARGGERIEEAVRQVLAPEGAGTPDLGGRMRTAELGDAIAARLS